MIEAVIFDMDGVIIDSEPFWLQAEQEVFAPLGIQLTEEMWRNTVGIRVDEAISQWYEKIGWDEKAVSRAEVKKRIVKRLIELINEYGTPMEGLEFALKFFETKGVQLALASSSDLEIIHTILHKLRLTSRFQVIHSAEAEKYGKPHPAVYLSAAEKLNVPPGNCLALEDSFNGLLAARAARMKCVIIPAHSQRNDPRFAIADAVLPSLSHFNEKLWQRLNQSGT